MSGADWQTLAQRFHEWYRGTPVDADARTERILAAVRRVRPPVRTRWQRLPVGARWVARAAVAAALGGFALGAQSWLRARTPSSRAEAVRFVFVAPGASHVALVGDFNGWDAEATPMRRGAPEEPWVVTVRLPRGHRVFTYAFILDGARWVADPNAPLASTDDFGSATSVLVLRDRSGRVM
ncbi:MAG: isoamylase early set domain-containing protein [Gemmatimonadota bacterium]